MPVDSDDEFYVGYLPAPARHRAFLSAAVAVLAALVIAVAGIVATFQRDPGDGAWDPDQQVAIEGQLVADPYPSLIVQTDSGFTRALLVAEGKRGLATGLGNGPVRVDGSWIRREGVNLLEVARIDASSGSATTRPAAVADGPQINLTGEIIDPKCYAGAMKPGEGKAHKACATLCVRGGIPPMLLAGDGKKYLLVGPDGGAITGAALEALLPFVGDRVEVEGLVISGEDGLKICIDTGSLRRS